MFRQINWKWSLPGLILVALLAAFFSPPAPGVTSGEFEYVQRVVRRRRVATGHRRTCPAHRRQYLRDSPSQKGIEAFGKEASAFTKRMVEGKLIRLEFDSAASRRNDGKDRYLRTLAFVFLHDGTHLNADIIRQGYGFAVSSTPHSLISARVPWHRAGGEGAPAAMWADDV
jgi:endonuclease YncB( thermonuclease family)